MSGGVDSSAAALLLLEQGWDVVGVYMHGGTMAGSHDPTPLPGQAPSGPWDPDGARRVASRLRVPLHVMDFQADFQGLADRLCAEYTHGRTPNPCIECNARLKFGRLWDYAREVDASFMATGHYARIVHGTRGPELWRGCDPTKDQSYVLCRVRREVLEHVLLPIGERRKADVRDMVHRAGLVARDVPESQDICFVAQNDYRDFVRQRLGAPGHPGPIVDVAGRVLGQHDGIEGFTIGQRRGLGVAVGRPQYVVRLDPDEHRVVVGDRAALLSRQLRASRVNWLVVVPDGPLQASVKIRYRHQAAPATVFPEGPDRVRVVFDRAQSAVTPGQGAVFYQDERVLGGGVIDGGESP